MRTCIIALILALPAAEPGNVSVERLLLWSGQSYEGLLLASDEEEVIFELIEPDDGATHIRRFERADVAAVEPTEERSADWVGRWRAFQARTSPQGQGDWQAGRLVTALEEADAGRTRHAIRGLRDVVRHHAEADRAALSRLIELHTGRRLEALLADLQIRAAAEPAGARGFRLLYRPTIEEELLAERLAALCRRLIRTPVPESGGPEKLDAFLEPPATGAAASDDADAPGDPGVRAHSIAAWLESPEDYDGSPEAARLMLGRVSFALNVLRERLLLASTGQQDEGARQRILADRKRLFELAAAARSRAEGDPTPAEREAIRQAALEEMRRQAFEEERQREQMMFPGDDDEDCDGRRSGPRR